MKKCACCHVGIALFALFIPAAHAQPAQLVSQERYALGSIVGDGAELVVEALVQRPLAPGGDSNAPADKTLRLGIRQLAGLRLTASVDCTAREARDLLGALTAIEAAEAKPQPPHARPYLGNGLPPPAAPFREILFTQPHVRLAIHDDATLRRLVVSLHSEPPALSFVGPTRDLPRLKLLLEQAVALLQ